MTITYTLVIWFMFLAGPNNTPQFTAPVVISENYHSETICDEVGKVWAKQTGQPRNAYWACVPVNAKG